MATNMNSTSDRAARIRAAMKNSARAAADNLQPGRTQVFEDDGVMRYIQSQLVGIPLMIDHVTEVDKGETDHNGNPAPWKLVYAILGRNFRTVKSGEMVKFWAGKYVGNQLTNMTEDEFASFVYLLTERPDLKVKGRPGIPVVLDYYTNGSADDVPDNTAAANRKRVATARVVDDEEFEDEEEEVDEVEDEEEEIEEAPPVKRGRPSKSAPSKSAPSKPTKATGKSLPGKAIVPAKKQLPEKPASSIKIIPGGPHVRGRGRPPTGAEYFSSKTGYYLDINRKAIRKG